MKLQHFLYPLIFFALLPSTGCNTGIESTKKITPTRDDRRLLQSRPEDRLVDSIRPLPLSQWNPDKTFLVSDNRASLIYDITDRGGRRIHVDSLPDAVLSYAGFEEIPTPTGEKVGVVRFIDRKTGNILNYATRRNADKLDDMVWSDFPMMIDLDMERQFATRLNGQKLWTRTDLWYDRDGNPIKGAKFIPVTITEVRPGNNAFPLTVTINDGAREALLPMNMPDGKNSRNTRSFQSLFSLSDPKLLYPDIQPDVWELICQGKVKEGMTKEECKLSKGNPKEVEHGHNWNNLVDYWTYEDGSVLFFIDDRLTQNRK